MTIQSLHIIQTSKYKQKLRQCIHCGMCLQACPTYSLFGTEMDGPRGRIALIRAASEGRVSADEFQHKLSQHILLCLACRSCETACPSGVKYGQLVEEARIVIEHNRKTGVIERFLRWFGTQQLMPKMGLLKALARLLWLYEISGLQRLVRWMNVLPSTLRSFENILPPISIHYLIRHRELPQSIKQNEQVFFFTGCIQEAFLAEVNQATLRVLSRNGYQAIVPAQQTCCGAAHLHLGDIDGAKRLARQNIDAFLSIGKDTDEQIESSHSPEKSHQKNNEVILCNAGGCGLSLKEYPNLLADDPAYASRAIEFANQVQDVSEFLFNHLAVAPKGELKARAVYSDSCHLRHGQKVIKQPRLLLKKVPGIDLVELTMPDRCCGSAGVYNITQSQTANAILDAKMADIASTHADLIVTSNTGCHMQLLAGVRKAGLNARVMHVVEVLDLSYSLGNQ